MELFSSLSIVYAVFIDFHSLSFFPSLLDFIIRRDINSINCWNSGLQNLGKLLDRIVAKKKKNARLDCFLSFDH